MKHYEIVLVIHPDQTDQIQVMLERYRKVIEACGGQMHRLEDWGRKQLAYPIVKLHKAHYILMNIEVTVEALEELQSLFRYNDAILRRLIVAQKDVVVDPSVMIAEKSEEKPVQDDENITVPNVEEESEAVEDDAKVEEESEAVEDDAKVEEVKEGDA